VAQLQLRCGLTPTTVHGLNTGAELIEVSPDTSSLLLYSDDARLPAVVEVHVNGSAVPQLSTSLTQYLPGDDVRLSGVRFAARRTVTVTLTDPSNRSQVVDDGRMTDDAGTFYSTIPLNPTTPDGKYLISVAASGISGSVTASFSVSRQARSGDPGVIWVGTDSSVYAEGGRMIINLRTTKAAAGGKQYGLILRITSEATGSNYYFYDDASDSNEWIHQASRPFWTGVPDDRDMSIPQSNQPNIDITSTTPSGRFVLTGYFVDTTTGAQVGPSSQSGFVVQTKTPAGQCFIATAAFGTPLAPKVVVLRRFRDQTLLHTAIGRAFVAAYYRFSPPLARFISVHESVRSMVRVGLWPVILIAEVSLWGHPILAGALLILLILMFGAVARLLWLRMHRRRSGLAG
jgi:hypothetical protein